MGNCFRAPENSVSPVITRPFSPGWSTMRTGSNTNSNATSELSTICNSTTGQSVDISSGTNEAFPNLRIFTFEELKSVTHNFKAENMIGEGGFGRVYKAWIDEKMLDPAKSGMGISLAVKKWKPESLQGVGEWQKEINILGTMSHPNLVTLLGYCGEDNKLLLVYEFMANGSLENHLFKSGEADPQPLSWEQRLNIATGAARALAFLHNSENRIIHRNFKPSHILLDSNFNPKISGLGLAVTGPTDADSHVTSRVMGTYGYAAPEYIATGYLNAKVDVYGFGVVLLEMLSGQRAIDRNQRSKNLVEFAMPYLSDRRKLARLMDPRLEGQYSMKAALHAAQLAQRCVASDPKTRPSMNEVVETLEKLKLRNIAMNKSRSVSGELNSCDITSRF